MTRIGVVTFPGTLDDRDAARAVQIAGAEAVALWHKDADLHGVDAVVIPGGFSYGDYLRCGAIAATAPVMSEIVREAGRGLPVLGICNGFQVLCESHLLPGALIRNDHQKFLCRDQVLRIENADTAWTGTYSVGDTITVPLKNGEGNFQASPAELERLEGEGRVVFRYVDATPTAVPMTSLASPTPRATSSASCPTPSTRPRLASARSPSDPMEPVTTAAPTAWASSVPSSHPSSADDASLHLLP